ncbi:hypothetical protein VCM_00044 [Pseudomonas phage VCM]|uniref:Uncharacterized protein n=1 Tax=Pseudomonas phage VCM TaxID=1729937 RepID=A0A0S4KYT2_9CAUD|nr:hypothetical protein VCM_00044 [Pseudomonas phage VCM]CUR44263.1 hypothetical protein VCM_00044 [Pseudomonas phage VCM]
MHCDVCDHWNDEEEMHCEVCDAPLWGGDSYDDDHDDNYGLYGDEEDHY